ncbi:hypothetical protein B0H21DRAFT_820286 [Amylocystis lapponica]|nr:hypothetical protein B0H21DRAFT_820286 [Amylocystis lapponica]
MFWDDDDAMTEPPGSTSRTHREHILSPFTALFDASCLDTLDDQLLASPTDSFADLCYARSVNDSDPSQPGPSYAGTSSWYRAFSPVSPSRSLPVLDDGIFPDSDSDSEPDLLTPIQPSNVPDWGADLSPSDIEDARHVRFARLPSSAQRKGLPGLQAPVPLRKGVDVDAELALLFSSSPPPDPNHSVHFFPVWSDESRRQGRVLKASANVGARIRSLAGMRAGLQR